MKMKRFHRVYLADVTESQGELFQYAEKNGYNLEDFITFYLKSEVRKDIDNGDPRLCNLLGMELFEELKLKGKADGLPYLFKAEWLGEFYSLLQWHSCLYSEELVDIIKPIDIISRYNVLHDLDINLAVEKVLKGWGLKYYE